MPDRSGWGTAGFLALVALSLGCGDPRCTPQNCQVLHACQVRLAGEPDNTMCFMAPGDVPVLSEQYCVQACQSEGAGAFLSCVSANFAATCLDGGARGNRLFDQISATCAPPPADGGTTSASYPACTAQCGQANSGCNHGCPQSDRSSCLACSFQCNETLVQCASACH